MNSPRRTTTVAVAIAIASSQLGCDEPGHEPAPSPPPSPPAPSRSALGDQTSMPLRQQVEVARRSRGVVPRVPSLSEREAYHRWVAGVARAAMTGVDDPVDAPRGFAGAPGAGQLRILHEDAHEKRGAGLVAIRPGATERIIIEAPHSFFESGTLELALMAFDVLGARAFVVNTSHRGGAGRGVERKRLARSGKSVIDAAHNPDTFFAVAHDALLGVDRMLLTVQLHGFADGRAPDVDVVLSAARSNAEVAPVAEALGSVVGRERVRLHPEEITILGGNTNVEARTSRKASAPFLHLELSRTLRDRLRGDANLARRFVTALGEGVSEQLRASKRRRTP